MDFSVHAHAGAFAGRFDKQREVQVGIERFAAGVKFLERSGRQAVVAPDALGHGFVQADGVGQHARGGVGDAQHFEQRRHLRLAPVAHDPFGDIKANIRTIFPDGI